VTNGADPLAPGGGHNSHAGAVVADDGAAADDGEDEAAAAPTVPADLLVPAEDTPAPPEPPVVDVVAVAAVAEAAVVAEVAVVVEVGKLTPPYGVVRAVPATPGVAAVCATEGDDQNTESTSAIGDANLGKPVLRQLRIIINPRPIQIFGSPETARGGICGIWRIHPRPRDAALARSRRNRPAPRHTGDASLAGSG
jgi:hypothetical protein